MMRQTWRWFGPDDAITLDAIRQAGVEGIVTALYHLAPGTLWTVPEIEQRISDIEKSGTGLFWDVVESLPVTEDIRTGGANRDQDIEVWIASIKNLAAAGLKIICYNFMPVLDWTRTDLKAAQPSGALALRYDLVEFALFEIFILERKGARTDYKPDIVKQAEALFATVTEAQKEALSQNIMAGLPGAMESWSLDGLRQRLAAYEGMGEDDLRANFKYFLEAVVPVAEGLGVRLCCHPDDPPWPVLGLPRIVSSEADYQWLVDAVPSDANGITFCTGSLGARGDNDLVGMIERLGSKIHFVHLRNVQRDGASIPCSFHEADHLEGSTDMVGVIKALKVEEEDRRAKGRVDWQMPVRPDHGQEIAHDQALNTAPGYPYIGRLKGLAELRGVMMALDHDQGFGFDKNKENAHDQG